PPVIFCIRKSAVPSHCALPACSVFHDAILAQNHRKKVSNFAVSDLVQQPVEFPPCPEKGVAVCGGKYGGIHVDIPDAMATVENQCVIEAAASCKFRCA